MIYFIQVGHDGPIKIGYVKNKGAVKQRLSTLQIGNPKKLCLIGYIHGYRKEESHLHSKFKAFNIRGEWFYSNSIINNFIKTETKKHPGTLRQNNEKARGDIFWRRVNKYYKNYVPSFPHPIYDGDEIFYKPCGVASILSNELPGCFKRVYEVVGCCRGGLLQYIIYKGREPEILIPQESLFDYQHDRGAMSVRSAIDFYRRVHETM